MNDITDKNLKHLKHAIFIANNYSKDRGTKVGALIVNNENSCLTWGYNGFPRGINDEIEERHERPTKYDWSEHAERNAIYNAAREGIRLKDSIMYVSSLPTCVDCARGIIQSGIRKVYMEVYLDKENIQPQWKEKFELVKEMFDEAGIEYFFVKI